MYNNYPEQLTYDELLNPKSKYMSILGPRYIPIHPAVYNSEFAYTRDFAEKVLSSLDDSVLYDIQIINKTLGIKIECEKPDMRFFNVVANPLKRSIDVEYGSSNIAAEPESNIEIMLTKNDLSGYMIEKRAKIFSMTDDELKIPTWYIHNIDDNNIGIYLFYRNFAILFNNLGIDELKSPK